MLFVFTWVIIGTALFHILRSWKARHLEQAYAEYLENLMRTEEGEPDALAQICLERREEWAEDVFVERPVGKIAI